MINADANLNIAMQWLYSQSCFTFNTLCGWHRGSCITHEESVALREREVRKPLLGLEDSMFWNSLTAPKAQLLRTFCRTHPEWNKKESSDLWNGNELIYYWEFCQKAWNPLWVRLLALTHTQELQQNKTFSETLGIWECIFSIMFPLKLLKSKVSKWGEICTNLIWIEYSIYVSY